MGQFLMSTPLVPAVSRGEHFPSIKAAAICRGVSPKTAHGHLKRNGNLETLGVGRGGNPNPNARNPKARPVSIGPASFPSRRKAAQALGIAHNTLARWLDDPVKYGDALMALAMRHGLVATRRAA